MKVSESKAAKIREDMFKLVDNRLIQLGYDSLMEFHRANIDKELFDAPLCPFVNVLCPDDLCYLPAGHVGSAQDFHITGTVAYDYAVRWGIPEYMEPGTSRSALIHRGARLAQQMRLDELDGMG